MPTWHAALPSPYTVLPHSERDFPEPLRTPPLIAPRSRLPRFHSPNLPIRIPAPATDAAPIPLTNTEDDDIEVAVQDRSYTPPSCLLASPFPHSHHFHDHGTIPFALQPFRGSRPREAAPNPQSTSPTAPRQPLRPTRRHLRSDPLPPPFRTVTLFPSGRAHLDGRRQFALPCPTRSGAV